MRKCVWIANKKTLKITEVAKEPKSWRFAHGCGEQRNYPTGFTCNTCKKGDKCAPKCEEKSSYGGL